MFDCVCLLVSGQVDAIALSLSRHAPSNVHGPGSDESLLGGTDRSGGQIYSQPLYRLVPCRASYPRPDEDALLVLVRKSGIKRASLSFLALKMREGPESYVTYQRRARL